MRLSSFRTIRIAPTLAVALGTLLVACGEVSTDPTGVTEGLPVAFGHVAGGQGHGKATITILQQPVISPNVFAPGNCLISYSFEMSVKGKEMPVRWSTYWWGGDHDGDQYGSNVQSLGSKIGPVVVPPIAGHLDHGHSFDALRIVLTDENGDVLAQADTEGRTVSCS